MSTHQQPVNDSSPYNRETFDNLSFSSQTPRPRPRPRPLPKILVSMTSQWRSQSHQHDPSLPSNIHPATISSHSLRGQISEKCFISRLQSRPLHLTHSAVYTFSTCLSFGAICPTTGGIGLLRWILGISILLKHDNGDSGLERAYLRKPTTSRLSTRLHSDDAVSVCFLESRGGDIYF